MQTTTTMTSEPHEMETNQAISIQNGKKQNKTKTEGPPQNVFSMIYVSNIPNEYL